MPRTALPFVCTIASWGDTVTTIRRRMTPVLIDLAGLAILAFDVLKRAQQMIRRRVASGPETIPVRFGRPVAHVGATETFGRELRSLRNSEVSPELVSDIETELRWGLIWHDFERAMQNEIDRVFAPYLDIARCRDFNDLRELIGLPELTPA
jgi:hypothetical protein